MTNHEDILNRLDTLVRDIASLGLYTMADRLEEFTGDLEEALSSTLAQPARPEPDAIEQALAHAEAFSRGHDAGWQSAMLCAALTQALKR